MIDVSIVCIFLCIDGFIATRREPALATNGFGWTTRRSVFSALIDDRFAGRDRWTSRRRRPDPPSHFQQPTGPDHHPGGRGPSHFPPQE